MKGDVTTTSADRKKKEKKKVAHLGRVSPYM